MAENIRRSDVVIVLQVASQAHRAQAAACPQSQDGKHAPAAAQRERAPQLRGYPFTYALAPHCLDAALPHAALLLSLIHI
eukprot:7382661-Prymnesium_polylepis.1